MAQAKDDFFPVIDIFAGPGGLGEGFSSLNSNAGARGFKVVLSIEKEYFAHQTLKLRAFYREFLKDAIPNDYYQFLQGQIKLEDLYANHPDQSIAADRMAWQAELGVVDHNEVDRRIIAALNNRKKWVLIGGPPCQAYSIAGRSRKSKIWREDPSEKEKDEKHFLYREYLRILSVHTPPVFIMENVKGMLSSNISEGKISDLILNDLRNLNYCLYSLVSKTHKGKDFYGQHTFDPKEFIIQSEKYGIPQKRHRVIILGIRGDLNIVPGILTGNSDPVSLADCIGDLPKIRSGLSKSKDSSNDWINTLKSICDTGIFSDTDIDERIRNRIHKTVNELDSKLTRGNEFIYVNGSILSCFKPEWFLDENLKGVCNHSSRGHIKEDLFRYLFASSYTKENNRTPKLSDFPRYLLPNHANVDEGISGGKFSDRFRVQLAETPSTTITSHISKDGHYFIHPDTHQCRSLTVREAARLQTFPDNYFFLGHRTSQYVQVGNAVPPLLAKKIAEIIKDALWQID